MANSGRLLCFMLLLISLTTINAKAQAVEDKPEIIEKHSCEIGSLRIDILRNKAEKTKERIFVIFRGGNGETAKANSRRLQITKKVLLEKAGWSNYSPETIFATGEIAKGHGRVEFYIGGKLSLVFLVKKNRNICVYCCDLPGEK